MFIPIVHFQHLLLFVLGEGTKVRFSVHCWFLVTPGHFDQDSWKGWSEWNLPAGFSEATFQIVGPVTYGRFMTLIEWGLNPDLYTNFEVHVPGITTQNESFKVAIYGWCLKSNPIINTYTLANPGKKKTFLQWWFSENWVAFVVTSSTSMILGWPTPQTKLNSLDFAVWEKCGYINGCWNGSPKRWDR